MTAILLGLLLGMRHALDADHVVAVTAIVSRERSLARAARVGVSWGIGHSAMIFAVGGAIVALRLTVAPRVALAFEGLVALMLVVLGVLNVWRFRDDVAAPTLPPMVIGLVHGLAGSAAIALLVLATIRDPFAGAVYLLVFGVGTIVGMMVVTSMIAASALAATKRVPAMRRYVRLGAGALSLVFGLMLARAISVEGQLFGATPAAASVQHTPPPAQASKTDATKPSPATMDELLVAIRQVLDSAHVPGAGIAIVDHDSVLWVGGVGIADSATRTRVSGTTQFHVASITKTFTSIAIMQLVEREKLDLRTPIHDIAPDVEITNPWDATDPVRVEHVLRHTAGFNDRYQAVPIKPGDPQRPLKDVLHLTRRSRIVRWVPGSKYTYTNADFSVAGYVVERASQRSWEDYLADEILTPLGMTTSAIQWNGSSAPIVQGYRMGSLPNPREEQIDRPAYSLRTTPVDMARFIRAMINRGALGNTRILAASSVEQMEATTGNATTGFDSYGIGLHAFPGRGTSLFGHGGSGWGTESQFEYSPEYRFGYFIAANAYMRPAVGSIANLVFDFLVRRNGIARATPAPRVTVARDTLAQYVGYYRARNPRTMSPWPQVGTRVFLRGDSLFEKQDNEQLTELVPVSANSFRVNRGPVPTRFFIRESDGTLVFRRRTEELVAASPWIDDVFEYGLYAAVALAASAVLFAFVWIPRKLLRRMPTITRLRVRAVPLIAFAGLVATVAWDGMSPEVYRSRVESYALIVFASLCAALAIAAIVMAVRARADAGNRFVRVHSLLTACGALGLLVLYIADL